VGCPPYAVGVRLAIIAAEFWAQIDGYAAFRGGDLLVLPPARFFNAVYTWAIDRATDRDQFDAMLTAPMNGVGASPEAELDSFASFASSMGGTAS